MKANNESSACGSSSGSSANQKLVQQIRKQQSNEFARQQRLLDLDVLLSGFPVKPNCKTVVESFLGLHKVPVDKVKTFYQFENKTFDKIFHHVVITFKDMQIKSELIEANANLQKPIRWNQLSGNDYDEHNPIIKLYNRLSKFNYSVEKQLHRLKTNVVIAEYKFNTTFYCYKETQRSEWETVSTDEDLDIITDFADFTCSPLPASVVRGSPTEAVVNHTESSSSTFDFANFKKPPRNIIIPENSVNDQKLVKQNRRQQVSENERQQRRLDLDIILSGFPVKPICKTVVESFLRLHKVSMESVKTFYQFENKTFDETFYQIVITFKSMETKHKLFEANTKIAAPITWHQLSGSARSENNSIIKINHRFSKFNFDVEKQLYRLKRSGIIAEYRFNRTFYCFKQTPVSEWKDVSVEEDLGHLIDLLKYVKKLR